jgi:DNA-binding CsgD family transcriptional regulator
MLSRSRVLVVTKNRLSGIGMRAILQDCFSPASVTVTGELDPARLDAYDHVFLTPDTYIRCHNALSSSKVSVIVLMEERHTSDQHRYPMTLWTAQGESGIIEDLERLLIRAKPRPSVRASSLSAREIEVLTLVARGQINKHIADALSISLHTVISHRKNITSKLGIKTVSGLTMYAVLNGLISSKDIG